MNGGNGPRRGPGPDVGSPQEGGTAVEHAIDGRFEVWMRPTDDPMRGVSAIRLVADAATWEVAIAAGRLVPTECAPPLHEAVTRSLLAVPRVVGAFQASSDIWMVHGEASGAALVRACAEAVDGLADALNPANRDT